MRVPGHGKWGMAAAWLVLGSLPAMGQAEAPVLVPKSGPPPAIPVETPAGGKGEPWLGVSVAAAPSALYAQLRDVPKGIGFLVEEVAEDGPAEKAGLDRYDLLWKMDDQLLVNQSQFLTLLALREVGDTVRLTFFRGGENREVDAVLAARPASEKGRDEADLAVLSPSDDRPVRVLTVENRIAVLRDDSGSVQLQPGSTGYDWVATDAAGRETGRGSIAGGADEQIPPEIGNPLRSRLKALVRSFEQIQAQQRLRPARRRFPQAPVPLPGR